jgi:hypothetical protein
MNATARVQGILPAAMIMRALACGGLLAALGFGNAVRAAAPIPQEPQQAAPPAAVQSAPQGDPNDLEHLRRDQDEILRKASRLQDLMSRLLQRYQREGKKEQVDLLQQGIAYLQRAGIVQNVAGARDALVASAWSEAQHKQRQVIDDLEHLLDILLERKSIENLKNEIDKAAALGHLARDLERQQTELQQRTNMALQRQPTATERELADRFEGLARDEEAESRNNARQAGTRRPFLEDALRKVQDLLQQQDQLEKRAKEELAGAPDPVRQQVFDLGNLIQRTRELMGAVRDQSTTQKLAQDAKDLQEALRTGDKAAVQQARDRLQARTQQAPRLTNSSGEPAIDSEWQKLGEALQKAGDGDTDPERKKLAELADKAAALAAQRAAEATKATAKSSSQLHDDAAHTAEQLADGKPAEKDSPAAAVTKAGEQFQQAHEQAQQNKPEATQDHLSEALRNLEQAKDKLEKANPGASERAGKMAGDANRAAHNLENIPQAQKPEMDAAKALDQAESALRTAAKDVDKAGDAKTRSEATQNDLQQSRASLQSAHDTLQSALQQAASGRAEDMQQAAARQEKLAQQAEALHQQLQQAAKSGQLTPGQQKAAGEKLQQAQQSMQGAQQALKQGQQSTAAGAQQDAAQQMRQASEALTRSQQLDDQQKQALKELGKEQQKLQEDIVRLAQDLKQRKNPDAQRAADEAARAAQKAQQAMDDSDPDTTQQEQEKARQKLKEAADSLEEEQDRYRDLRQEELLFRMKEELTNLMQKQEPITKETLEAQAVAQKDGMSRAARSKLNRFSEEEQELAARVDFVIKALTEEGNLVFQSVLKANYEDLREVSRRLAGRSPDAGSFTTMLQGDVEHRTTELIAALDRERQRRENDRKQQQQQQQQGKNKFNPQKQKLVSLIADLQMLKQLEEDTRKSSNDLQTLLSLRGDAGVSEAEAAMIERLGNRHGEITSLFAQIKARMEEALKAMQQDGQDGQGGQGGQEGHGHGGK